jgi:glycosyltransferase involved in cell wall biosynthesis
MTLLFVTQKLDESDPVLGFVIDWIRALGARTDLTVIANQVGEVPEDIGVEVVSLGRELGRSRQARGLRFLQEVRARIRSGHGDVLLAHMCPVYLNLAAPVLRARGARGMLWFAHPALSASLRIADRLADVIFTSLPGAYPLPGPKLRVVGQAVDLDAFAFDPHPPARPLRLVAVGRTSPSKGFSTIVHAAAAARAAGSDVRLTIVGPSTTAQERAHRNELGALLARTLGAAGTLLPGVSHAQVPAVIAEHDVLVNAMVAGSGDKVVFEAAALGRPVVVSNPAFAGFLQGLPLSLTFGEGDHRELAERIQALAATDAEAWIATTKELRVRVERDHSLDHWADAVADSVGGRR